MICTSLLYEALEYTCAFSKVTPFQYISYQFQLRKLIFKSFTHYTQLNTQQYIDILIHQYSSCSTDMSNEPLYRCITVLSHLYGVAWNYFYWQVSVHVCICLPRGHYLLKMITACCENWEVLLSFLLLNQYILLWQIA